MKDIVIVGAGGFGREVAWLIEEINIHNSQWNLVGFIDDNAVENTNINDYKVIGNLEWLTQQSYYVVLAVGDPKIKKEICKKLKGSKNRFATLIHPSVIHSPTTSIGEGSIICAGNIITVNAKLGNHVIVNLDSTIGHDGCIKDYVTILPSVNISGNVVLNECVSVGTGTQIIQGINVGENTIIGAGSTVVKNLPENVTAVGSPAKPIKYHS